MRKGIYANFRSYEILQCAMQRCASVGKTKRVQTACEDKEDQEGTKAYNTRHSGKSERKGHVIRTVCGHDEYAKYKESKT